MTTAAEFYGDPFVLDEIAVMYSEDIVSRIVPVVMGMLLARDAGASADENLRIFHDDLRYAVSSAFRWMGDPDNLDRSLDRMIEAGVNRSREIFPAVDAFMRGEFDQFFQQIAPSFQVPESG